MVIGLTGGIACGKSEVCRILEKMGFVHIDADDVAHDVLELPDVIGSVTAYFGNDVLSASDDKKSTLSIDRKKLGAIVFDDNEKMNVLESITHPVIIRQIKGMINSDKTKDYVIEAIELVSSGLLEFCDELWVVHADREQQLTRLMENRHMNYEEACMRLKSQENHDWNEADADHIIFSTEPIETMEKQVREALLSRQK